MMYDNSSLNWLMAFCALLLVILPFIRDPYDRIKRRITWSCVAMILLVLLGIHFTNEKDNLSNNKDKQIKSLKDSIITTNKLLIGLGINVDSLLKRKNDTLYVNKSSGVPQIGLKPMTPAQFLPRIDGLASDTLSLILPISNTGNGPAAKLESEVFILAEGSLGLRLVAILPDLFNGHEVIPASSGYDLKMAYLQNAPLPERIYFYCTVKFQDLKNKSFSPLQDLFMWERNSPSVVLNPGKATFEEIKTYVNKLDKTSQEYQNARNSPSRTTNF